MPYLVADAMPFIVRTDDASETGVVPWEMPIHLAAVHWSALWGQLRRRVPDDRYHRSIIVTDVAEDDQGAC